MTDIKRSAGKIALLLPFFALLLLALIAPAAADDTEAADSVTTATVEIGGRYADTDGDRSFIAPYDPMDSGVIVFFDLLNFKPGGRSFEFEGRFTDDQDWNAGFRYGHGAAFEIGVSAQEFFHAGDHRPFAPAFETPAPPFGSVHVEPRDFNPDADYHTDVTDVTADFKIRAPSYPAHISGDARIYRKEGPNQMRYFFRSCSTHICHINSKTRDVDTETREFNIGFDSHAGPVDIVYKRNFLNFDDNAPDPVDFYGDFIVGRPRAGQYEHHTNPETKSFYDEIKINTNLTNRAVLGLHYSGGESENEESEITEDAQRFVANGSYTFSAKHFASVRYIYNRNGVDSISAESAAIREAIGDAVEPGTEENAGEVTYRYNFSPGSHLHAHVRHTDISRDDTERSGLPENSSATTADLDSRFRVTDSLGLEGELARDWVDNPVFATDFTDRWRCRLGANWTPSPVFGLLASYSGFFSENDDAAALERAYYDPPALEENFKREWDGHNLLAAATWMPREGLAFTLSYNFSLNDIQQDQILGTADEPGLNFRSDDNPFESRYHVGNVRADWSLTQQLRLALGATLIAGEESWEPSIDGRPDLTEGLSETARTDFTKYMVDAEVGYDFSAAMGCTLAAFYADYNDEVDDWNDGTGGGVMVSVSRRW